MSDTIDLMNIIVDYIKEFKAYKLPSVCKKIILSVIVN